MTLFDSYCDCDYWLWLTLISTFPFTVNTLGLRKHARRLTGCLMGVCLIAQWRPGCAPEQCCSRLPMHRFAAVGMLQNEVHSSLPFTLLQKPTKFFFFFKFAIFINLQLIIQPWCVCLWWCCDFALGSGATSTRVNDTPCGYPTLSYHCSPIKQCKACAQTHTHTSKQQWFCSS